MGFERDSFDTVTENITEAENSILFDEFNNIWTNKLAVILAPCGDKGDEDMQMLFFDMTICNYPTKKHSCTDWWNILERKNGLKWKNFIRFWNDMANNRARGKINMKTF